MRRMAIGAVLMILALPTMALVEGNQVAYVSGTTGTMKAGATGTLETTDSEGLVFNSQAGTLHISYSTMEHIGYHTEVARHLGVLPAMAAGLVRKRERKHFLDVSYHDGAGTIQVAQFELAKGVPATLLPVLRARAPKACSAKFPDAGCSIPTTYGP